MGIWGRLGAYLVSSNSTRERVRLLLKLSSGTNGHLVALENKLHTVVVLANQLLAMVSSGNLADSADLGNDGGLRPPLTSPPCVTPSPLTPTYPVTTCYAHHPPLHRSSGGGFRKLVGSAGCTLGCRRWMMMCWVLVVESPPETQHLPSW